MKPLRIGLAGLLLLLGGCDLLPEDDPDTGALDAAEKQWDEAGISDYQLTLGFSCFCIPTDDFSGPGEFVIVVRNAAIESAFRTDSGEYLSTAQAQSLPTVDALFDKIRDAYRRDADLIQADYDETYGFPTDLKINSNTRVPDAGVTYSIRDFM